MPLLLQVLANPLKQEKVVGVNNSGKGKAQNMVVHLENLKEIIRKLFEK